jgi:hypothetical protein
MVRADLPIVVGDEGEPGEPIVLAVHGTAEIL